MADSGAFNWLCDQLERATELSQSEARGTVRLSLKEIGLLAHDLTPSQASSVAKLVLPRELRLRGIDAADALCARLAAEAVTLRDDRSGAAPDEVFGKLAGG